MPSRAKPARVVFVGLDHPHTTGYLRTLAYLAKRGSVRLVGCWDPDPEVQVQRLGAFDPHAGHNEPSVLDGVPRVERLEDLLALEPDGGLVCLDNRAAPGVAVTVLEAGVNLLVEKPVARRAAELEPLAAAMDLSGARFTTGYLWRYHPGTRQVRAWLGEGLLGDVWHLHGLLTTTKIRVRGAGHFLFDQEVSGGGILPWLGCHWLDVMACVLDDEPVAVTAECRRLGDVDVDVEDLASVIIQFAGGATAVLQCGYLIGDRPGARLELDLFGSLGRVRWRPREGGLLQLVTEHPDHAAAPERRLNLALPGLPPYQDQHGAEYVEDFFLGRTRPERRHATLMDAARVLAIVEAAYASSEAGRRVEVSLS